MVNLIVLRMLLKPRMVKMSQIWSRPINSLQLMPTYHQQCNPSPIAEPSFSWGSIDSETLIAHVSDAYDEIVHWKMNLFLYSPLRWLGT